MEVFNEIFKFKDGEQAKHLQRFFKTGKGQYGEGDIFLGLKVPVVRSTATKYYQSISLDEIQTLLKNEYHEARLLALLIMVMRFEKTDKKKEIIDLYLKNVEYINNWDLVDLSAPKIIGRYIYETKDYSFIYKLANSEHLWSERIAVISQLYLIKKGEFSLILELSEKFLTHKHDLMHKAVGWMLREMGKVNEKPLCDFLDKYNKIMPRTMLRYSLEKLTPQQKAHYMAK